MEPVNKKEFAERIFRNLPYSPNDQQIQLIAALAHYASPTVGPEHTAERSADRVFLLNGHAGTGKTSLVGALVKTLAEYNIPVVLMAPTGRAAKVLAAACHHPAYTIHRRIYRGDSASADGFSSMLNENKLANAVFIVDEASMIGNDTGEGGHLLQDLIYYVFSGIDCKLILLGDSIQLPPVGCTESPAMNPDFLRGLGLKTTRAVITAPARQKLASGILYNATRQRIALSLEPLPQPVIYASPFTDVRAIDRESLADAVSSDYYDSPDGIAETIIITRSNRRATEFNRGVRQTILGFEEELTVGERLLVVKNNYLWGAKVRKADFIANGDVVIVERIYGTEDKYGLRFADVRLRLPDRDVELDCKIMLDTLYSLTASLDEETSREFEYAMLSDPDLFTPGMSPEQRLRALKSNPYYNALRVKYAYCVTCHKAQGGQWRNVYIDTGYIPPEANGRELYRWLYTATTRATGRVNFIEPPFEVK